MTQNAMATAIEKKRAAKGDYPEDWPIIAARVKALAGWLCERCGVRDDNNPDGQPDGTMLTVHHLDEDKHNCELWNLAALCQQCHLRIQARVDFYRDTLDGIHSLWMSRHVKGYNAQALMEGKPLLLLNKVIVRNYDKEWPNRAARTTEETPKA